MDLVSISMSWKAGCFAVGQSTEKNKKCTAGSVAKFKKKSPIACEHSVMTLNTQTPVYWR